MAQAGYQSITRRGVLAAPALVPALLPLKACAGPDPIFAALAAHAAIHAELIALFEAQDAADRALRAANETGWTSLAARLDALCAAEGPLGFVERDAADRIVATVPRTLAGAAACLRYVRERFAIDGFGLYEEDGYRALLLSTERAIDRALA